MILTDEKRGQQQQHFVDGRVYASGSSRAIGCTCTLMLYRDHSLPTAVEVAALGKLKSTPRLQPSRRPGNIR